MSNNISSAIVSTHYEKTDFLYNLAGLYVSMGTDEIIPTANDLTTLEHIATFPDVKAMYDLVYETTRGISRMVSGVVADLDDSGDDNYLAITDRTTGKNRYAQAMNPAVLIALRKNLLKGKVSGIVGTITIDCFKDQIVSEFGGYAMGAKMIGIVDTLCDIDTDLSQLMGSMLLGYISPSLGVVIYPDELISLLSMVARKAVKSTK